MPTFDEMDELKNNCTWTWTTESGIKGYRVTSNKAGYTGRSIFLPAAGLFGGTTLEDVGLYGAYCSSSLCTEYPYVEWDYTFNSNVVDLDHSQYRCYGQSVRPVCP